MPTYIYGLFAILDLLMKLFKKEWRTHERSTKFLVNYLIELSIASAELDKIRSLDYHNYRELRDGRKFSNPEIIKSLHYDDAASSMIDWIKKEFEYIYWNSSIAEKVPIGLDDGGYYFGGVRKIKLHGYKINSNQRRRLIEAGIEIIN